jgi:hypothetical protein
MKKCKINRAPFVRLMNDTKMSYKRKLIEYQIMFAAAADDSECDAWSLNQRTDYFRRAAGV